MVKRILMASTLLFMAGCGGIHPGSAAVVNGTQISFGEVDSATTGFCRLNPESSDNGEQRRNAVGILVLRQVAQDLAESEALMVRDADRRVGVEEREDVNDAFGPDADPVLAVIAANREIVAIAEALGARAAGLRFATDVASDDRGELREAGTAALMDALDDAEVDIDPRFGLAGSGDVLTVTGSLSAGEIAPADPASLPETQRCA